MVDLSGGEIFLEHDWLQVTNSITDWAIGQLSFRRKILFLDLDPTQEEELLEEFGIR
jgi:hypothetical protein